MSVQIYKRALAIEAVKPDGTKWRHDFGRSASAIVGNADGSITIKNRAGKKLHRAFDYNGRREQFLVNPPTKENPPMMILGLNPPGFKEDRDLIRSLRLASPRHVQAATLASERRVLRRAKKNPHSKEPAMARQPAALARYWAKHRKTRKTHKRKRRHALRANPPSRSASPRRRKFRAFGRKAMRFGRVDVKSALHNGAGVAAGIIAPAMILRLPFIPASLTNTPTKRTAAKLLAGYAASRLASKFVGPRFGEMVLAGTVAGVALDVLPKVLPQAALGLADGYDPMQMSIGDGADMGELQGGGEHYGHQVRAALEELPGVGDDFNQVQ